ncbi:hypothetical protein [Dyadobacter arcticus]|uniref:Uncharacterized protein n=1 Tax=Dyadobacter arcticus TaxID=1078754 RepID=A0ABX0UTR8_9BACT|nr:hypothetical protein [Dyadobacter arcticus]NIJ55185.1 hypothetical protein [Dyadobacter arcticus]
MENMKSVSKPILYLHMLNAASFAVITYAVIFCSIHLKGLPEQLHVSRMAGIGRGGLVNKSIFWDDVYLMVASYLVISLICLYLRVIPFRNNKGHAMAIMASLMNLCISSIFAVVIVGTLKQVTH